MAQTNTTASEPPPVQLPTFSGPQGFLRKLFRPKGICSTPSSTNQSSSTGQSPASPDTEKDGLIRRMSRKVVPGLPRTQTFKRQRSEQRVNLAPIEPLPEERRAVSVDRRSRGPRISSTSEALVEDPHTSAPGLLSSPQDDAPSHLLPVASPPESHVEDMFTEAPLEQVASKVDEVALTDECAIQDNLSTSDAHSMTTSQYDAMISEELERVWILNLSMHFRDRSKREKFFVTYREEERFWRRVTISLDYRNAPPNSLEMDLIHTHYQREKSAKIYEAIRESLRDIQFYDTVTNLKLQTTDGRLHVHVVEDGNEIIQYPAVSQIKHLNCRRVRERDIKFDSHMSGFVYKVQVNGQTLIKKEIPSPETIDEFLYEVNALDSLRYSPHVIQFHGVVVDDHDEFVKGLLISYAEQGALIDLIYETCKDGDYDFPWATREKWARQIVQGLSDIHESGFVQGDFTLSNIVIDEHNDAKIIDINRRGCPVGWEPPEATQLIECNQRISMYIGVKSDLYQLGMVLWALATQEDEPETQGRPLILGPEVNIPDWYRQMAEICLSDDPRSRRQASELLQMFPTPSSHHDRGRLNPPTMSVDEDYALNQYLVDDYPEIQPEIRTVEQPSDWSYVSRPYAEPSPVGFEPYYYTRGRSPPSPLPSNYEGYDDSCRIHDLSAWAANRDIPSSYSDVGQDDDLPNETPVADRATFIEPDIDQTLKSAAAENVENYVLGDHVRCPAENAAGKLAQHEESGNTSLSVPRSTEFEESNLGELPGVEYIIDEPSLDATMTKSVEVTREEYAAIAEQITLGPTKVGKDYASIRADSACDVVMPPIELFKDARLIEGEPLLNPRPGDQASERGGLDDNPRDPATSMTPSAFKEIIPPHLSDTETVKMSEIEQTQAKPQLNTSEAKGNTGPGPQGLVTETSSRTVTPSKAHDNTGQNCIPASIDRPCHPEGDIGTGGKKEGGEPTLVNDPNPLTGIGAAHLMNHDGDVTRHKRMIDEDLSVMEPGSPNGMMKTDATYLTQMT